MAKRTNQDLYRQVEIESKERGKEVCWIPKALAEEGKNVHFKRDNFDAKILRAYTTQRSEEH